MILSELESTTDQKIELDWSEFKLRDIAVNNIIEFLKKKNKEFKINFGKTIDKDRIDQLKSLLGLPSSTPIPEMAEKCSGVINSV